MAWIIGYFSAGIILATFLYYNGAYHRMFTNALRIHRKKLEEYGIDDSQQWRLLSVRTYIVLTILIWPFMLTKIVVKDSE